MGVKIGVTTPPGPLTSLLQVATMMSESPSSSRSMKLATHGHSGNSAPLSTAKSKLPVPSPMSKELGRFCVSATTSLKAPMYASSLPSLFTSPKATDPGKPGQLAVSIASSTSVKTPVPSLSQTLQPPLGSRTLAVTRSASPSLSRSPAATALQRGPNNPAASVTSSKAPSGPPRPRNKRCVDSAWETPGFISFMLQRKWSKMPSPSKSAAATPSTDPKVGDCNRAIS
mmetsp:Transcript_76618/g.106410  ORF Transcript_76618/g.106410 Transcript_76618/m.106410 type:complete len:228 (-) Transcript_76618:303-986(-)